MSVAVSQHKNYIGGKWVDSAGGETMEVVNPATGETIAEVPASTAEDADRAVQAAKDALPEWLDTTPRERSEMLLKLADVIEENAEDLAQIESRNVGKPIAAARDEPGEMADNLRFFAGAARLLEGRSTGEYMREHTSMIRREPWVSSPASPPGTTRSGWPSGRWARRLRQGTRRCSSPPSRRR